MDSSSLFKTKTSDSLLFNLSEKISSESPESEGKWKILVVDDESDVHEVTKLVLDEFELFNKQIELLHAYSAAEAQKILESQLDIAIILLDVVMESEHAGLDLVKFIRSNLNNKLIRIILRTGQPGIAPEKTVVKEYDINDYKSKTELSTDKLFTCIISGLRSYDSLVKLDEYTNHLEKKVEERTKEIHDKNLELEKLSLVASNTDNAVILVSNTGEIEWVNLAFKKFYGYTVEEFIREKGANLFKASFNQDFARYFIQCRDTKKSITYICYVHDKDGRDKWIQSNLIPVLSPSGEITRFVIVDTDITPIKKAEEEITFLFDAAVARSNEIDKQKCEIEFQKQEIMDSINYAYRIQSSILPSELDIKTHIPNHFIYYKPRDVVSGDFYWISKIEDTIIFATADCTGHGVPGAFMSLLGIAFLNEIVNNGLVTQPAVILRKLRKMIINVLQQKDSVSESGILVGSEGMDIALCAINQKTMELQFAGANNPLLIIRSKTNTPIKELNCIASETHNLFEFKGDNMPVGLFLKMEGFSTQNIKLEEGDNIYMFSDGYKDQFGGKNRKKYKSKNFFTLLLSLQDLDMAGQRFALHTDFESWKKHESQTDDILVVGLNMTFANRNINLSDNEIVLLNREMQPIGSGDLYNISKVLEILATIPDDSDNIIAWKKELEEATLSLDETKFQFLLDSLITTKDE